MARVMTFSNGGRDLLSGQMFEILLPACIIVEDVNYPRDKAMGFLDNSKSSTGLESLSVSQSW